MRFGSYVVRSRENLYFDVNNVIKNTYMLLSTTVFFSSFVSFLSIKFNTGSINSLLAFGLVLFLLFLINYFKTSVFGLFFVFVFTGFLGYASGPIVNKYLSLTNGKELILFACLISGFIFSFLSLYVLITKKNFDFLHGFLFIGILVLFSSMVLNFFFNFVLLHIVLSGLTVILFSIMILFDTSRIVNGGESNYILATVSLYLNLYNIFFSLLSILNFLFSKD